MLRRPSRLTILLGVLLGAAPSVACGQGTSSPDRTILGFELGFSRASFSPALGTEDREGGMIGGFIAERFGTLFALQGELLFTKKGGSVPVETQLGLVDVGVQLIYVEAPLLARVTLPVGTHLRPVVFGGGSFALSVGCEFQFEIQGALNQARCDQPGTGLELSSTDWSGIFGGGVEYGWHRSAVRLELRRLIGLKNLVEGVEQKNRAWVVLFGINF
jgi:hypothetical protein